MFSNSLSFIWLDLTKTRYLSSAVSSSVEAFPGLQLHKLAELT